MKHESGIWCLICEEYIYPEEDWLKPNANEGKGIAHRKCVEAGWFGKEDYNK